MIYLLETELLNHKPIRVALNSIFGIGKFYSNLFCRKLGFSKNFNVIELTEDQKLKIVRLIDKSNILINSDLKRALNLDQKKLIQIKSYRGLRKLKGFPVRGQRTRSNARTAKKLNRFI